MGLDAWIAIATVVTVFLLLAFTRIAPYLTLFGAVALLMALGVIDTEGGLKGFANEGMITVGALFIVAGGLQETGVVASVIQRFLGRPKSVRGAQARLMLPVAVASAFLNNTPIVAMLMPVVSDWAKRIRVPASQLLIPLSYAAILGGMCTLIGTSTNLVVHGLLLETGRAGFMLFDISLIGVPLAVTGILYLLIAGPRLLPTHEDALALLQNPREYTLEMVVDPGGPLVGKTLEQAGLHHLPGLYVAEIHRRGRVRAPIPSEVLDASDQLILVGRVDSAVDAQKLPGLRPATEQLFKLDAPRWERWFVEAVVSDRCPLVGMSIRRGEFRTRYDAVVIGVARGGARIGGQIADIVLQPGDVLLIEAPPSFLKRHRLSNHFYLVSRIEDVSPPNHERAWLASGIVVAMVLSAAFGLLPMLHASLLAAGLMLVTRCLSEETARRQIDWTLLIAIGAAFGLGYALESTGAAAAIAKVLLAPAGDRPLLALALIYLVTMAMTELITNNAAAVLVFPIAIATAEGLGVSYLPFVVAVMMAASAAFATPIGYQTNLMVYGAGAYKFSDFTRVGLPLNVIGWAVTVTLVPLIWPF